MAIKARGAYSAYYVFVILSFSFILYLCAILGAKRKRLTKHLTPETAWNCKNQPYKLIHYKQHV